LLIGINLMKASLMKLTIQAKFTEDVMKTKLPYSFLNFASLTQFFSSGKDLDITYFCDGMLMALLVKILTGKNIERVSFDYTSIASEVFCYAEKNSLKVYIVGASQDDLDKFVSKITRNHPRLIITGCTNGYFKNEDMESVIQSKGLLNSDIVLAGLGAGKQELFINLLVNSGFSGVAFTCGGFIRQEANSEKNYYPSIINKLHLRFFYRMLKEPHTIKRYFIDYPTNLFMLLFLHISKKINLSVS